MDSSPLTPIGHRINQKFCRSSVTSVTVGLRRSELFGLQWGDLNFHEMQISIQRSIYLSAIVGLTPPSDHLNEVACALPVEGRARRHPTAAKPWSVDWGAGRRGGLFFRANSGPHSLVLTNARDLGLGARRYPPRSPRASSGANGLAEMIFVRP